MFTNVHTTNMYTTTMFTNVQTICFCPNGQVEEVAKCCFSRRNDLPQPSQIFLSFSISLP